MRKHFKYKIKGDTVFYISRSQTSHVHHFNLSSRKSGISHLGLKSEAMVVGFDVVDTLLFLLVEYPDNALEVNVFDLCRDATPPLASLPLTTSNVASITVISRDPIFFTLIDSSHSVLGTFHFCRENSTITATKFDLPAKANALILRDGSLFSLALDYSTLHISQVGDGTQLPCTELDISVTHSPILDFIPKVTSAISESKQPTSLVLFTKQAFTPGVGSYFLHLKLGDSARNHVLSWHPNEGVIMAAALHSAGQTKAVTVCTSDGDTHLVFEFTLA